MVWTQIQYPSHQFGPPNMEPSEMFEAGWMAAIDQENHQMAVMPVYPIPYYFWQPSIFFQMEPDDQVNPAYAESWQNLSTMLMPEYSSESLSGGIHNWPSFFQVLSTPVFLPDGTGVVGPTRTEEVFPSRTTTEPE